MKKLYLSLTIIYISFIFITQTQVFAADQKTLNSDNLVFPGFTQGVEKTVGFGSLVNQEYVPISPITDPGTGGKIGTGSDLPNFLKTLYRIGIGLCFALGVIMFTIAGIEYLISESFSGKSDAKGRIIAALTGLAIALVSYILLRTINPELLNFSNLKI